ncbi:MAG: hypothetical protein HC921_15225 [Synechococcaceae cyanobacterium SM2_3_1]|nr:hypothetical protein [Synechococcaceae cyanobacterium SM2_3_1]
MAEPRIIYSGGQYQFPSEAALETFVEQHFSSIFPDLELIERQMSIENQRCDLLCLENQSRRPVIIELKNEVDRGIVPQLTRYRKYVLQRKAYPERIDYTKDPQLIAVAPDFHEDNYTDRKSSKYEYDIHFLRFSIQDGCRFIVADREVDISYPVSEADTGEANDEPVDLMKMPICLYNCDAVRKYKKSFTKLRRRLIELPKVEEFMSSTSQHLIYGNGYNDRSKKIAEIRCTQKGIFLFLWLPAYDNLRNIKEPKERFGLVMNPEMDPFDPNSKVKYLVCSNNGINEKEKDMRNRRGMQKWTEARQYLQTISLDHESQFFVVHLLKGVERPLEIEVLNEWRKEIEETPTVLSWFLDLSIKLWLHRIR